MRAQRLGLADAPVLLASETHVETILATLEQGEAPDFVVIDSIQTLWTERVESAPGTVTQVRTSAQALTRFAKKTRRRRGAGRPCHQGRADRRAARRRAHGRRRALFRGRHAATCSACCAGVKNRYGATDEIGVFEMTERGLEEVANPSALFLDERDEGAPARRCSPASRARGRC